jgi:hypothetical protein
MASFERSLGWNTATSNDGASTYDSSRMILMELKTLGQGIFITGSYLAVSGLATNKITIADGAAMINGYFYESTAASDITISGLAAGSYTLALIANASAGSYTVAQTAAGTTTVLASTVRMAVCTAAQLTTIGTANYIAIATLTTSGSVVSALTSLYPYAVRRNSSPFCALKSATGSITNNANTQLSNFPTVETSGDGVFTATAATGSITVNVTGVFLIDGMIGWDASTLGYRQIFFGGMTASDIYTPRLAAGATLSSRVTTTAYIAAGNTINIFGWQNSGGTRSFTDSLLRVVRL